MKQILFLLLLIGFISSNGQIFVQPDSARTYSGEGNKKTPLYTYKIIPSSNSTWCYDIFKAEKMLIHQTNKPGLPGTEGFKNKADAEKVAKLVIEKLKKGEMPPTVTMDEMKKLKIF